MRHQILFFLFLGLTAIPVLGTAQPLLFVTLESPPAEYLEDGRPSGRNIEIVEIACERLGYRCTIRFVPWKRALNMVRTGTADGIIDAAFNLERAAFLHFPDEPINEEQWYAFKRTGASLTLDRDLANAGQIRLGASRGFEYGGLIQEMINAGRFKSVDLTTGNASNIKKLIRNRFDMFIGVRLTILFLSQKMGHADKIDIVKMSGTNQAYLLNASKTYLAFSKQRSSREMANRFSNVFLQMKQDGTVARIDNTYIRQD